MTDIENYHDWLRDAHAMEKQAESMLESMVKRTDSYPELCTRLEQHLFETRRQITVLDDIIARNNISRSVLKDSMSKIAAMGQSIGGMFPQDEVVKGVISGYVFEQFEVACYTSLLTAAQKVNDHDSIADLESILAEERGMAEWLLQHNPDITEQYIIRSETPGLMLSFSGKRSVNAALKSLYASVGIIEIWPLRSRIANLIFSS